MTPPLDGVRVLDLSIWRPGPYCTQLLVELGADVVKVEPPGGDPMRVFPGLFAELNKGKRSGAVDLKAEGGRELVLARAAGADVAVEGFRPGVAARLGIGEPDLRAVRPSIVWCSISGYGQDGPLVDVPGHDLDYQAWAGSLEPRAPGAPPVEARPPIADLGGGAYAAMAICAALVRRATTGEGESIDVSMTDVLASWTGAVAPDRLPGAAEGSPVVAGYGTFATRDGGWVALGVLAEDHLWAALCAGLGLDDVAGLTLAERSAEAAALQGRLATAIGGRDRDALVAELSGADVPVAPVLSRAEVLAAPLFRERGLVSDGPDGRPAMHHPVRFAAHDTVRSTDVPPLADDLPDWLPRR